MNSEHPSVVQVIQTTDSELLADLNEEIQTLHHTLYPAVFKKYNRQEIQSTLAQLLQDPAVKAYTVSQDKVVVGYVLMSTKTTKETAFTYAYRILYINQIAVRSPFRAKGFGEILLERVYREAKELGIHRIELDHWTLNESSRHFFKRSGFHYINEKMIRRIE